MKLSVMEKTGKRLVFKVDGVNEAFVNALRRIMVSEISVMSVEDVYFEINTSGFFDEVIAHRLGLIPLTYDSAIYTPKNECKCEGKGCSRCEVVLALEREGPCVVKSGDLKSTDETVKPTNPNIPIVEMLEGQKIKLEASAQLGKGMEHSKWQAAIASYSQSAKESFIFKIETVSGLSAPEVLEKAMDVLEKKSIDFLDELKRVLK